MIEYLYDAIRAVAGQDITIAAQVTDEEGVSITDSCDLMFYGEDGLITMVDGIYTPELDMWTYTIPADITKGLNGRYFYSISRNDSSLCFKQPLYLVWGGLMIKLIEHNGNIDLKAPIVYKDPVKPYIDTSLLNQEDV